MLNAPAKKLIKSDVVVGQEVLQFLFFFFFPFFFFFMPPASNITVIANRNQFLCNTKSELVGESGRLLGSSIFTSKLRATLAVVDLPHSHKETHREIVLLQIVGLQWVLKTQ